MTEATNQQAFHTQRVAEFRANGGKLNPPLDAVPLLVLTTIGARIIVVAAVGGAPHHPAWYHDSIAHPEVTVEVEGETFQARAAVATAPERARPYAQHTAQRPNVVGFRQRTARQLPVIIIK